MNKMSSHYGGCKLPMLLALFLLGFFYYYMTSLRITILEFRENKTFFSVETRFHQNGTLYCSPETGRVKALHCGEKTINFSEKAKWHETNGELVENYFSKPMTLCALEPESEQTRRAFIIQKYTLFDFLILFVFWGAPIIYFLFPWLMFPFEMLKIKNTRSGR